MRYVEGVVVVFGEGEGDDYVVFGGAGAETGHLGGGEGEGVFGVERCEGEVDGAGPGCLVRSCLVIEKRGDTRPMLGNPGSSIRGMLLIGHREQLLL